MSDEQKKGMDCECKCLTTCSEFIQHNLETFFGNLGRIVAVRPWLTIVLSVAITLCFSGGFANWTTESRAEELWIPQNTQSERQAEWVSDVFGYETRTEQILLRPSDNGNVLKAAYIEQYWIAHYIMVNQSSPATSGYRDQFPGEYSWNGYDNSTAICQVLGVDECEMDTILDVFGYGYANISALTDDDVLEMLNDESLTADLDLENLIGGLEYDDDGNITSGSVLAGTYKVESQVIVDNNEYIDPSREQWEIDAAQSILDHDFSGCKVVPSFEQAFSEEFGKAIGGDAAAYSMGCLLLILYCVVALGKRDYVHSMMGLAFCAVLTVGLAVVGSYGLAAAFGLIFTPLSGSLPFLVLGLGVDDAFIIAGEFQQQIRDNLMKGNPELPAVELMQRTLKHAGVSVLITSFTDFMAFSIGASTLLPALQAYCLYAAFGVMFVFILNITFFAACVVLDHQRANANRADCCCCFKLETPHPMYPELMVAQSTAKSPSEASGSSSAATPTKPDQEAVSDGGRLPYCGCCHMIPAEASRKIFRWIGEQMENVWVKVGILTVFVGMFSFGIYGAFQLEQDFKLQWFLPDSSYLQTYYDWQEQFFDTGTPVFIYSKDIDYLENKQELLDSHYLLLNASYLEGSAFDWHLSFWQYADDLGLEVNSSNYYSTLNSWINTEGARYTNLLEWNNASDPDAGIAGAFMIGAYKESAVMDAQDQVDAMNAIRDDMDDISDSDDIFGFTFAMVFWEQYAVIAVEFYRNLVLAVIVVFSITLLLIPKISAALLVLSTVVATIVDVLGFMWLWGLTIDGVTVCYTVIAIGLAVDYSAHVGEAFVLSTESTKAKRVTDAMYRVGASVFNGAFSTFLAVVAMAGSQTYVFRVFFKQFFLVTSMGVFHGLIVLPVLLSLFGPDAVSRADHDQKSDDVEMGPSTTPSEGHEEANGDSNGGDTNGQTTNAVVKETTPESG